jgi:hypothetical protein
MNCNYCNTVFISKTNLNHHQKTAKYCLEIQGKINENFICNFCNKKYSTHSNLNIHLQSCKEKEKKDQLTLNNNIEYLQKEIQELQETNILLQSEYQQKLLIQENKIKIYEKQLVEKNKKIEKLENHLMRLSERPTNTTNNNTTNNNQRYQQLVQNLVPLKDEHYVQIRDNLTEEHVKKGVQGYVDLTYIVMKDKIICTDFSRRMITYKDENGNIIVDPKMDEFARKVFTEIQPKCDELTQTCVNKIIERLEQTTKELCIDKESMNNSDILIFERATDKILEERKELVYLKNDINEIVQGKDNSLKSKYIEKVCQKTYRK